jgi:hypothetical protein
MPNNTLKNPISIAILAMLVGIFIGREIYSPPDTTEILRNSLQVHEKSYECALKMYVLAQALLFRNHKPESSQQKDTLLRSITKHPYFSLISPQKQKEIVEESLNEASSIRVENPVITLGHINQLLMRENLECYKTMIEE